MEITNTASTSAAASLGALANNAPSAAPRSVSPPQEQQNSTTVTLSAQAQQMSRAENKGNTEQTETKAKETTEPSGIQFMEGESKSGQINVFA